MCLSDIDAIVTPLLWKRFHYIYNKSIIYYFQDTNLINFAAIFLLGIVFLLIPENIPYSRTNSYKTPLLIKFLIALDGKY